MPPYLGMIAPPHLLRLASVACASCLSLKTPFSELHLPLPPCLVSHYHHLRRLVFFLCHLRTTSAASSSSFFMMSSPFMPSSSRPNQRTRLHGVGVREEKEPSR
ncbi:hypothetical protein F2Q69_00012441 [Brassica cretica]|uniref:Uncharacterized protein n=1 Tax=Brassica cretica TaxID=69181 RepID=A0A8S9QMI4_BRACR|nr:hypothetical protein F2Q69_00012441 [Brassica cretica]